jgi:fatty-acyl-CoA synthase
MVTQSDPDGDAAHVATTVGVVVPHTELRVVNGNGDIARRDEVGELCVRSPPTMLGYWNIALPSLFSDKVP